MKFDDGRYHESTRTVFRPCSNSYNDNDNDKRPGLTAKADQPDHKKIQYTKNKNGQWSSANVTHELSQNVE